MIRGFRLIGLSLIVVFVAMPAVAKTLYVTDTLSVNLRSEPVQGSAAVELLKSNAALEVLGGAADLFDVAADQL